MTQRMLMATLAGDAADACSGFFRRLGEHPDTAALDRFCASVSERRLSLPIVYFCEWVDRWLMGDLIPGPDAREGATFTASCFTPAQARAWAGRCGDQHPEQASLAARLREAAHGWGTVTDRYAVVVIRDVRDGSTSDEEVEAALKGVPGWLALG